MRYLSYQIKTQLMKSLFKVSPAPKHIDVALLIGRIGISLMMFTHGFPKISRLSQDPVKFMDFMGLGPAVSLSLAILAEIGCSILVILGLGTRFAAIPLIFVMLTAVLIAHASDPFATQEKGFLYILMYLVLLITGSGRFSLDKVLFSKKHTSIQTS